MKLLKTKLLHNFIKENNYMNKTLKLIAIFTIVCGGLSVVWASSVRVNPVLETVPAKESVELQRQLYTRNCARCHGADGHGQTTLGKSLDTPDLSSAKNMPLGTVENKIRNGDGSMPAFKKKLKAADITSLAKFVRSF